MKIDPCSSFGTRNSKITVPKISRMGEGHFRGRAEVPKITEPRW